MAYLTDICIPGSSRNVLQEKNKVSNPYNEMIYVDYSEWRPEKVSK